MIAPGAGKQTGTQDDNGIAFLPLPEQPMTSVSLSFAAATFCGVMDGANIDLLGARLHGVARAEHRVVLYEQRG